MAAIWPDYLADPAPEVEIELETREVSEKSVSDQNDSTKTQAVDRGTVKCNNQVRSSEKSKDSEVSKDISALYGLLAIVSSICVVPLSEIVTDFDADFLRWAETANFLIAILFLLFCFAFLFRPPTAKIVCGPAGEIPEAPSFFDIGKLRVKQLLGLVSREEDVCVRLPVRQHLAQQAIDSGSFYLKVGCMIFGVGAMVYSCITFGVFLENYTCFEPVMGVNPLLQILFISLQLIFIFRNSQFTITKYRAVGRLGMMHLVVLNLLICLRVIVDETIHEFVEISEHEAARLAGSVNTTMSRSAETARKGSTAGTGAYLASCVSETSIMKSALNQSTTFLFPCIIEYALISAGIIFTMWRGVGYQKPGAAAGIHHPKKQQGQTSLRVRTSYRIDCDQALGGLLAGLIVVVLVVVGLILFFMGISDELWKDSAVIDWMAMDLGLNSLALAAVCYCLVQFCTKLDRIEVHSVNLELDDSLLMFAMIGVYAYCVISLLGTSRARDTTFGILSTVSASLTLVQSTLQTIFLFDAGKRGLRNQPPGGQRPQRPGKQTLTFLLVLNFAIWAVNVFCALRTDGTPSQRDFFGTKGWTVMIHVTVPLIIFYRFHSTACIFEVWKRAYREPKALNSHSPTA